MMKKVNLLSLVYYGSTDIEFGTSQYIFRCPYCNEILSAIPLDVYDMKDKDFINNLINNKIEEYGECPCCNKKMDQKEFVPD